MALFGRKTVAAPLPPIARWEYRCGDGRHWGYHYCVSRKDGQVRLGYSRVMPERMESIAAPQELWQKLTELAERYRLQDWAGYNECRPRTPRTKRWLLYLTFADGSALRAEGCGAAPRSHDKWEDELLALLNSCIDL